MTFMGLLSSLSGLPLDDRLFLLLSLAIQCLLGLAIVLALLTVFRRWRNTRESRKWMHLAEKWDPVILEVLGGTEPPGPLLALVLPTERFDFLEYLVLYARRIRGEDTEVLKTLARPFLPLLLGRMGSRWGERRAGIVRTLGTLGMPEYAGLLAEALDDPSSTVAFLAAQALLEPGSPGYLRQVTARLHRFHRWHPGLLARLLARVGPEAAPVLRPVLSDSLRPLWVRAVVAQALRLIRDIGSADAAAEVVEGETDEDLVSQCLRLLAEVGESRHKPSLLPLLRSPRFHIRAQALRALQAVGGGEDLPIFRATLGDESPWVAIEAARGMKALGGTEELRVLASSEDRRSIPAREVLAQ